MEIRRQWSHSTHASRKSLINPLIARESLHSLLHNHFVHPTQPKIMQTKLLTIAAITLLHGLSSMGAITTGTSEASAQPIGTRITQTPTTINNFTEDFQITVKITSSTSSISCLNLKPALYSKEMGETSARLPLFYYRGKMVGVERNYPPTSCFATFQVDSKYKGKAAYLRFDADKLFCMDRNRLTQDINNTIDATVLESPMNVELNCSTHTWRSRGRR